jgi:hypothetical protein
MLSKVLYFYGYPVYKEQEKNGSQNEDHSKKENHRIQAH